MLCTHSSSLINVISIYKSFFFFLNFYFVFMFPTCFSKLILFFPFDCISFFILDPFFLSSISIILYCSMLLTFIIVFSFFTLYFHSISSTCSSNLFILIPLHSTHILLSNEHLFSIQFLLSQI